MKKILAASVAVIALLAFGSVASADIDEGTFDDDGVTSGDGRFVTTQVSFECEEGDRYFVRLTITQDETGAFAQMKQPGECTGDDEDLVLSAPARGNALFDVGDETEGCALVRTKLKSDITGAEQFCEDDINLEEEEEDADDLDDE